MNLPLYRRVGRLILALWYLSGVLGCATVVPSTPPEKTSDGLGLIVTQLELDRTVVRSGELLTLFATLRNDSGDPVYDLDLSAAVGLTDRANIDWEQIAEKPQTPNLTLAPGEEIAYEATIRLNGSGWFEIGVAGNAANTFLMPQGKKILVVEPRTVLGQVISTFLFFFVVLGAIGYFLSFLRRSDGRSIGQPNPRLMGIGALLLLVATFMFAVLGREIGQIDSSWFVVLPFAAVAVFFVGWMIVGTGLRFGGSFGRSAAAAVALYFVIGVVWVFGYNARLGTSLPAMIADPSWIPLSLIWPLQVAQVIGLFGLDFN